MQGNARQGKSWKTRAQGGREEIQKGRTCINN
jgi:hypothetical protein